MLKKFLLVFLYTNHRAIFLYKVGSWFYKKGLFKTAYAIKSLNITLNGCDISPAAKIGSNFTICHTIGIVIGDGVVIGDNLIIYQNVTIGTKDGKELIYPIIGNDVTLFASCTIAGNVRVGDNVIVGANSLVLKDIPSNHLAIGNPSYIKARA